MIIRQKWRTAEYIAKKKKKEADGVKGGLICVQWVENIIKDADRKRIDELKRFSKFIMVEIYKSTVEKLFLQWACNCRCLYIYLLIIIQFEQCIEI